jgi:hypothetical protein
MMIGAAPSTPADRLAGVIVSKRMGPAAWPIGATADGPEEELCVTAYVTPAATTAAAATPSAMPRLRGIPTLPAGLAGAPELPPCGSLLPD